MKAYVVDRYKQPLRLADLPEPTVGDHDVLIAIAGAGVNVLDEKVRDGQFKLVLPYKTPFALGHDLAGVVAQTGPKVTRFTIGDEVFGRPRDGRIGTFAQRLAVHEDDVSRKPRNVSMAVAASVPLVALTAWQALVDVARVRPGQRVLIHGGSGGVGTYAVQLAEHLGATVATTAGTSNVDWVRDLGADTVIDYKTQQFDDLLSDFDVVLDSQGGRHTHQITGRAQAGRHRDQHRGTARSRVRRPPRALAATAARDHRHELEDPAHRQEPQRPLRVPVHAPQRRTARRDRCAHRNGCAAAHHRLRLPVLPSPCRARARRRWPQQGQGRHHHHRGIDMRLDLPGRTVAITGAGGGLGSGLARALRAQGANVALLDLDAEAVHEQASRLGGDRFARGWSIDVRDLDGLQQVMGEVAEHFGAIDVIVAGAGVLGPLETIDIASANDWDRVIDINLSGVWRTLKAAAPHVAASQGHIVAISSLIAYVHPPLLASYAASKAGVAALCDALRASRCAHAASPSAACTPPSSAPR